jgi:ribosomal protein S18 acetylase RimI-like enzyme
LLATAARPVDLTPRLDEPALRALLEIDGLATRVRRRGTRLLGMVVEESWQAQGVAPGTPVACIGLRPMGRGGAEITALAVLPDWRRQGLARSLVYGACAQLDLRVLEAETDGDAVGFYRAAGFSVQSLGERYPGVERFGCRLELPPP